MLKDADLEKYIVNDFVYLTLIRRRLQTYTVLYLGGKQFKSFNKDPIGVFVNLPNIPDKIFTFEQDPDNYDSYEEAKQEFDAYCSIFKNWAENDYNIKYFNHKLTFPALKRLAELHDPLALKAFPLQVKTMIDTGNIEVINYLILNDFIGEEKTAFLNSKELENNLIRAINLQELAPYTFPILKTLIDFDISWATDYFANSRDKIKQILIEQLYHEDQTERHRAAAYFEYFGSQFANKEYFQIVYELGVQDLVIKKLNQMCELALGKFRKDKNYEAGLIIRYIIKDLVALDDKEGVRRAYDLIKDDPYGLGDEVRTYFLSEKKNRVKHGEVFIPECEAEALKAFEVGQKNSYKIPVYSSENRPSQAVDFDSFLAHYNKDLEERKGYIIYTVKDNHVNGLYIFFTNENVCDECPGKSFKICYDECIYFIIPPFIGVLDHLEELIIFDEREYTGYHTNRSLKIHLPETLKLLHNLKILRVPDGISKRIGSLDSIFETFSQRGTKIYGPVDQSIKDKEQAQFQEESLKEFKSKYENGGFDLLSKEIKLTMDLIYQLDNEPTNQVYLYTLYKQWVETNDINHLMHIYDKLGRSYLQNRDVWILMIQIYIRVGMADPAIRTLQHFLKEDPLDKFKWNLLGSVYTQLKQHGKAFECYQKQYEVNPDLHDNLVPLSFYHEQMGSKEKALEYIERYISLHPENAEEKERYRRLKREMKKKKKKKKRK